MGHQLELCLKPPLTREQAEAAKRIRSRDNRVAAYYCAECDAHHVGSQKHKPHPMRLIAANHEFRNLGV